MDKVIIYTRAEDNGVSIVVPSENFRLKDESDEELCQRIIIKDVPVDAINVRIIDKSEVPLDRYFRDAWQNADQDISVNMLKARDIHIEKLKEIRKQKLEALDREYMIADEKGDSAKKAQIAALKQKLRDIPQDFDLTVANSPEELKSLIPEELK